jgi:hypothetical protein
MAVATFDTLKFANTLKAAGVPDKQAEAQAAAFAEVIQLNLEKLVTKDDLSRELKDVEQRLGGKIDTLAAQLRGEMTLLKWMFGAVIAVNLTLLGLVLRLMFVRIP